MNDSDIDALKRQVSRLNPTDQNAELFRDGKLTFDGFVSIFSIFMKRFDGKLLWSILERVGYDRSLVLQVFLNLCNPLPNTHTQPASQCLNSLPCAFLGYFSSTLFPFFPFFFCHK